jgi:hypothetical protein
MNGSGFSIPPNPSKDAPAPLRPLRSSDEEEEDEVPF